MLSAVTSQRLLVSTTSSLLPKCLLGSTLNSGSLFPLQQQRLLQGGGVRARYQSAWVAPHQRGGYAAGSSSSTNNNSNSSSRQRLVAAGRRPFVNGKAVAFHVNDLKLQQQQEQQQVQSSSSPFSSQQQQAENNKQTTKKKRHYDSDLIVVLDMDECLIHSRFLSSSSEAAMYAHQLRQSRQYENSSSSSSNSAAVDSFRVAMPPLSNDNDATANASAAFASGELVHVHVRPGLVDFLAHVTARYETHIFTAAMPVYANPVLDHLCAAVRQQRHNNKNNNISASSSSIAADEDDDDQQQQQQPIFAGRWYREHCTFDPVTRAYVKDLSTLFANDATTASGSTARDAPLHKTVLVDNNPLSFLKNPENGILVNSFYTDGSDTTLPAVRDMLLQLEQVPDVRPVLTRRFQLADMLQQQQQSNSTEPQPLYASVVSGSSSSSTNNNNALLQQQQVVAA